MDDDYWAAVMQLRLAVADLLEALTPQEWDRRFALRGLAGAGRRRSPLARADDHHLGHGRGRRRAAGFNPHRINTLLARQYGDRPTQAIVARIREHAGERRTARVLDVRDSLFDVAVHSQDIAVPLGRTLEVPVTSARQGLDRVWEMGWPFPRPAAAGRTAPAGHGHRLGAGRGTARRGHRADPAAPAHRSHRDRAADARRVGRQVDLWVTTPVTSQASPSARRASTTSGAPMNTAENTTQTPPARRRRRGGQDHRRVDDQHEPAQAR